MLTAVAVLTHAGRAAVGVNPGARGFTEILFAYASCMANNGLALGGLDANNVFYNTTTIVAMLAGRYGLAALALLTAGRFAAQRRGAASSGTLPVDTPAFGLLLLGTILLAGAVSFLPALAMGPTSNSCSTEACPRMRRLALLLLPAVVLSIAPSPARGASEAEPTITTDRPSVANSSVVIPQDGFQMENGLLASNLGNGTVVDLPESTIRYGLLPRTELRITLPDYYYSVTSAPEMATGFGDTAIGVKQQLGPLGGFDVSIIVFSSFPTGAKQVSSHGYDPGLQIPWSHGLGGNWTVAGQVASYWPTVAGRRDYTSEATVLHCSIVS